MEKKFKIPRDSQKQNSVDIKILRDSNFRNSRFFFKFGCCDLERFLADFLAFWRGWLSLKDYTRILWLV